MMNTLVEIDYYTFVNLEKEKLLYAVFPEDFSQNVGKKHENLKEVMATCTKGQQSLFSFMGIYYHNKCGWNLFLYGLSSRIEEGLFESTKSGLAYLGDKKLFDLFIRVEKRYFAYKNIDPYQNIFEDLDFEYNSIKEDSLINAIKFVRNHPQEFFKFLRYEK